MTSVPHSGAKSVTPGGSVAGGAAFTPGPWLVSKEHGDDAWIVWTRQPHTGELAHVFHEDINGDFPAEANARLIAAAPDLLEALQGLMPTGVCLTNRNVPDDMVIPCDITVGELRAAAQAIAKATAGETRNAEGAL